MRLQDIVKYYDSYTYARDVLTASSVVIIYVYALLGWSYLNKTTYATVFSLFPTSRNMWMR